MHVTGINTYSFSFLICWVRLYLYAVEKQAVLHDWLLNYIKLNFVLIYTRENYIATDNLSIIKSNFQETLYAYRSR